MKGKIIAYSPTINAGLIECMAGNKYPFSKTDWQHNNPPKENQPVIFEPEISKVLKAIKVQPAKT